jgi:hypothetical protein
LPEAIDLEQLNERLWQWIEKDYHIRCHGSTGQPPLERYLAHIELIRQAPKNLRDYFRSSMIRKVYKDRTVSLNGRLYEAPVGLIGRSVRLLYHEEDPQRIEVICNEQSHGFLVALNLTINSRVRRISGRDTELVPSETLSSEEADHKASDDRYRGGKLFGGGDRS